LKLWEGGCSKGEVRFWYAQHFFNILSRPSALLKALCLPAVAEMPLVVIRGLPVISVKMWSVLLRGALV